MSERNEPELLFQTAMLDLIRRSISECGYEPEYYRRLAAEHGCVNSARLLLAENTSDDSLQLWARGRSDLTIEALVSREEWKDLFSDQERAVAERRYGEWRSPAQMARLSAVRPLDSPRNTDSFLPEDPLDWNCELLNGHAVCEKLAQMNRWCETGNTVDIFWPPSIASFRRHLAECQTCAKKNTFLIQGLDEFDNRTLKTLGDLLGYCVKSLNFGEERAKRLLSDERRAAGFTIPPSEAEAAGVVDYGYWKDNTYKSDVEQVQDWLGVLGLRAAQLCARVGGTMLEYEQTLASDDHPWIAWWKANTDFSGARFVRGFSDDQYLAALLARNLALLGFNSLMPPILTLPTDGDLGNLDTRVGYFRDGVLKVERKTESSEWKQILLGNFSRHRVTKFPSGESSEISEETGSELGDLRWERIVYLAWCAASRETAPDLPEGDVATVLRALGDLRDKVDSNSALQLPVIELLERIVRRLESPNREAANESLRILLGTKIYGL